MAKNKLIVIYSCCQDLTAARLRRGHSGSIDEDRGSSDHAGHPKIVNVMNPFYLRRELLVTDEEARSTSPGLRRIGYLLVKVNIRVEKHLFHLRGK